MVRLVFLFWLIPLFVMFFVLFMFVGDIGVGQIARRVSSLSVFGR